MKTSLLRRGLCALAIWPALLHAQDAPTVTKIVIGYGAGGGADAITRAYAQALATRLNRTVVVENRPGAGGTLAVAAAKSGPRDGSLLVFGNVVTHVLAPYTYRNLAYDPANDFAVVGEMARFDLALAVNASTPVHTLAEFVTWAKADPRRASFGTAGSGSLPHFFGLLLGKATGLPMVNVPYKSGSAINNDLIGGQLPSAVSALSDYVQMQKAGRLRMLATSGETRARSAPDVPTFRELGYPQLTGHSFFALFAPAGLPAAELSRLQTAMRESAADPQVQKVIEGLGIDLPVANADDFSRSLRQQRERWAEVVRASGFTAEN